MINSVVISSGHGLKVRGASGEFDEVDQARRVTEALADALRHRGIDVHTFHDDTSTSQDQNLKTIVAAHNDRVRDLDVSVHFNAYDCKAHGTEVCYLTQKQLAAELSAAIAMVGFTDRGPKYRDDLYVLNHTNMPAVLLEVCFCDSAQDAGIYKAHYNDIIDNIASVLAGEDFIPEPEPEPDDEYLFHVKGTCSYFGGPDDMGVSPSEGLAFHFEITEANQHLFLPLQPDGTTGLARRLNAKAVMYVACRWNYDITSKEMLASDRKALVRNLDTGAELTAWPADWGPHEEKTGRAADLSLALMEALDLITDDEVEVIYPWEG
jgi:N-acetylmuramoyl-L-alanine amidase